MITVEAEKREKNEYRNDYNKATKYNKPLIAFLLAIILVLSIMFTVLAVKLGRIGYRNGDLKEVNNATLNMINIINISNDSIGRGTTSSLGIFKTKKETGEKTIAPGSTGTYKFCIQNVTDDDIKYDINFSDLNQRKINMKYRLKIDNVYIKGNENSFVNISDLSLNKIRVLRNSNNIFTLEWMWAEENDQADTQAAIGDEKAYYTINLQVTATRLGV